MLAASRLALIKTRVPVGLRRTRLIHSAAPSACRSPARHSSRRRVLSCVPQNNAALLRVAAAHKKAKHATLRLPRKLARPAFRAVSREALCAVDEDLTNIPLSYVHEKISAVGKQMLSAIAQTRALVPENTSTLPTSIPISFAGPSALRPTHMLAVRASTSPVVTFLPAHSTVLATHCAHLPALPPSTTDALPVVPLTLPSPATFPALQHFLYTRDAPALLSALLTPDLMHSAARVNGVWRNACALGVSDDALWHAMDAAWAGVLLALGGQQSSL